MISTRVLILFFGLFQGITTVPAKASKTVLVSGIQAIVEATPNEFPWVVRIATIDENGQYSSCHGAILNENWVLTDWICGYDPSSWLTLFAGDHDIDIDEESQQVRGVIRTIRSPAMESQDEYDLQVGGELALIELDSPWKFNEYVQPIKFATPDTVYTSDNVTKLLWLSRLGVNNSTILMKNTEHVLMSDNACLQYIEAANTFPYHVTFHPESVMCSDVFKFLSPYCQVINGEPMTCQTADGPVLCGLGHTYSYHCDRQLDFTLPNTFTEVASMQQWISDRITLQPESNATWVAQDTGCGGVLNGSAGHLSYKPDEAVLPKERCTWTIRSEDFSIIRIHLIRSTLGPNDVLVVSDFYAEEPAEFNTLDLTNSESDLIVRGPIVFITFESSDTPSQGFSLEFYGSGLDQALDADVTDVHLNFQGTFHYPDGQFYPWWASASFVVNPEGVQDVNMTFTELDVFGFGDFVYVYQWNGSRFDFIDQIWDDMEVPRNYNTSRGMFVLLFVSDNSVAGKGFTIEF